MTILEVLYQSGVCRAHGEALKLIHAGVVKQNDQAFTSLDQSVYPLEICPVFVGKYKRIDFVKGAVKYSKIGPSKER